MYEFEIFILLLHNNAPMRSVENSHLPVTALFSFKLLIRFIETTVGIYFITEILTVINYICFEYSS